MPKKFKGFTLIELMVVISIIALLSAIGFSVYGSVREAGRDAKRKGDIHAIQQALEQYYSNSKEYGTNNKYPCFGTAAVPNCGWANVSGISDRLVPDFIQQVPVDPSNGTSCPGYLYLTDATQSVYTLFTKLENTNDSVATNIKRPPKPVLPSDSTSCTGTGCASVTIGSFTCSGSTYNYWVNSMQ